MRIRTLGSLASCFVVVLSSEVVFQGQSPEAPAGYVGGTNGYLTQTTFDDYRELFERQISVAEGLGPVYEAQSCGSCHTNPVTGGSSQIPTLLAGHWNGQTFVPHRGDVIIHARAIDSAIQEQLLSGNEVRSFRLAPNTLGAGFLEAVQDQAFRDLAASQPPGMQGEVIMVPFFEAPSSMGVGRFSLKNQHASLLSKTAKALREYVGLTNPLQPAENTSNGRPVDRFDPLPDPENFNTEKLTDFMRSTKVPPRDEALAMTSAALAGEQIFNQIGCQVCHTPSLSTAPPGTVINGGTFTVPPALGNKVFHPYSDFLLHDVGTGDGIAHDGLTSTRNKMRTAPLWGLRTRNRLMHDGLSPSPGEAIIRHRGEATGVTARFSALTTTQKVRLITFLLSL